MSTTPIVFDIAVDSDVDIAVGIDKAKINRSRTGSRAAPLCAHSSCSAPRPALESALRRAGTYFFFFAFSFLSCFLLGTT